MRVAELRTLQLTDIHDDYEKYEVISQYLASKKDSDQAIDAVFITGDFIEGDVENKDKTASLITREIKQLFESGVLKSETEEFDALIQKHVKDGKVNITGLDETVKKDLKN